MHFHAFFKHRVPLYFNLIDFDREIGETLTFQRNDYERGGNAVQQHKPCQWREFNLDHAFLPVG